jgi:hypothetical protein
MVDGECPHELLSRFMANVQRWESEIEGSPTSEQMLAMNDIYYDSLAALGFAQGAKGGGAAYQEIKDELLAEVQALAEVPKGVSVEFGRLMAVFTKKMVEVAVAKYDARVTSRLNAAVDRIMSEPDAKPEKTA